MEQERESSIINGQVIQAITKPIYWAGVPRELFLLNLLVSILMIMIFHFWYFLLLSGTLHLLFVYLGKQEPLFYEIFFRYNRTKKYYWG